MSYQLLGVEIFGRIAMRAIREKDSPFIGQVNSADDTRGLLLGDEIFVLGAGQLCGWTRDAEFIRRVFNLSSHNKWGESRIRPLVFKCSMQILEEETLTTNEG